MGDPIFDAFFATQVVSLASAVETDNKIKHAGSQLIDKIGVSNILSLFLELPADNTFFQDCLVFTHSQAGQFGWILGDSRPKQVKAIVAIEPNGPPFMFAVLPPFPLLPTRAFGLTDIPLTYSPPIVNASQLNTVIISQSPNVTCFAQAAPARKLANLVHIPVLMVTSEASFHAPYDNCTAHYLNQAGVSVDHVNLGDVGIHGNGHLMFLEKNSLQIVEQVIQPWLNRKRF